jgi:hypothetical protein
MQNLSSPNDPILTEFQALREFSVGKTNISNRLTWRNNTLKVLLTNVSCFEDYRENMSPET